MNTKKLIEDAKRQAPNLMVHELIQEFEEFAGTLNQLQTNQENDEEKLQNFMKKMSASYERLSAYFMRVAASFGMTVDQFSDFIGNPNNFDPKDWEEIEATKKQLSEQLKLPKADTKNKKMNKNLKI
jgi:hypothetical protein